MSVNVTMPALSPTMTSGTVAKWTIAIGDRVHSGDVIAEIETDKATMEVEAIEDGVVAQILVEAGTQNVAVGTVIAVLAEDGEAIDEVALAAAMPTQGENAVQSATKTATHLRQRLWRAMLKKNPLKQRQKNQLEQGCHQKRRRVFLQHHWRGVSRLTAVLRLNISLAVGHMVVF